MITQEEAIEMERACTELSEHVAFAPTTVLIILESYVNAMNALQAIYEARPFEPDARKEAEYLLREAHWDSTPQEEMN